MMRQARHFAAAGAAWLLGAGRARGWRLPFTTGLLATMLVANATGGSLTRSITGETLLGRVGYGLDTLRAGRLDTLVTNIPFALYPWMLATITFLVLIGVAPFELAAGWRRTAIVFFAAQVGGYLLASLLVAWPLAALGSGWGRSLATARDVGPSAGAFGCLAALAWYLPRPWRRRGIAALGLYLLGFLLLTHRIWDVEHLIAGLIGLGTGWLLVERGVAAGPARVLDRLPRPHPRDIAAALVVLVGLMNVVSALVTTATARVQSWDNDVPFAFLHGSRTFVALSGLGLILLGRGLRQGRRVAWLATLALLAGGAVSHVIKGLDIEEATIEVMLLTWLLWRHGDYLARPDLPTVRRSLISSALALLMLPLYAALGFWLLRGELDRPFTVGDAARETLARVLLTTTGRFDGASFEAAWFLDSITWIWVAVLLVCVVALLRPVLHPTTETAADRRDALDLLHRYGGSPVAHMTTWPGNTLLLNHHRDAYIAYRLIGDVALVLGDPVGAPAGRAAAIREFAHLARRHGWTPCFYGVGPALRDEYARNGLTTMQAGEDAYLDLPALELRGRRWQDARTALNRARREGVELRMINPGNADPEVMRQLREISDAWLRAKRLPEMGFTLGSLAGEPDREARLAAAVDGNGRVHGFVSWLPVHGAGGWVIDIMRRRPDAFNGIIEFLIVGSALAFRDEGAPFVSLATAPLARVAREGDQAGAVERAVAGMAGLIEPFYAIRSLFEFKSKFSPRWEPVYIAYPGAGALPKIGYAIMRAYLPNLGLDELRALVARPRETPAPRAEPTPSEPAG
ncbi:MAG TPA: DUF2156 domain-containing protein [Thermomicrobiales bacterium]|nr:DUF2156 domain-containing protein [Thermomicrobiales bacterium]